MWFNPGREPRKFYGPGMLVLALSIFPTVLAALAMSREGEQRTILQVYVSSISAHEFLLGKILAGAIVGLAAWLLLMGLMFTLFGLRLAGDPTPLLVASVLFVFCVASFGTLVGAALPNQAAAVQAVGLGGFLLAFLLSGLIFPVENIPAGAALDLVPRPGALLHRRRARRIPAGRRLARRLGVGADDRRHRARLLRPRVADDAPHAGEGMSRLVIGASGDASGRSC